VTFTGVRIAPPQETELTVIGRVLNANARELISGAQIYYGAAGDPHNILLASDGTFRLKIPKGVKFDLIPEKIGFSGQTKEVLFRRDYWFFREQYIELLLNPLEVNAKIESRLIYFQQSKAIILEESYGELERLATLLLETPKLHIRIEGHTDNIGKAEDLLRLSEERAEAIRDFLVKKVALPRELRPKDSEQNFQFRITTLKNSAQRTARVEVVITKI